jgi:hypothetical protein
VPPRTNIFVPSIWTLPSTPAQILIVDNDEDVLVSLERVLEDQSFTTATAINYEQACMLLSQRTIGLLVLDDYLSDRDSSRWWSICVAPTWCRRSLWLPITDVRRKGSKLGSRR